MTWQYIPEKSKQIKELLLAEGFINYLTDLFNYENFSRLKLIEINVGIDK